MVKRSKDSYKKSATFPSTSKAADKTKRMPQPSLLLALVKAFGLPFAVAGFLKLISDLLSFVGPQVLKSVSYLFLSSCDML